MDGYVIWLVLGFALVVIELATGTLYLLFLGLAAFAGAVAAYAGTGLLVQVMAFAVVAAVALIWVQRRSRARPVAANAPLELNRPVTFENWIDPAARLARVRFRGTHWDALVQGECRGEAGEVLYIRAIDGPRLTIGARTQAGPT